MSNYKLTFQLKQHTPMIHFQGDQHGATLRATELKPKLDKFMIEQEELTEVRNGKRVPKSGFESWFISKDHLALNYRVKLNAPEEHKTLGNVEIMPGTREKTVFSKQIDVKIITSIKGLLDMLERHYCAFFALNNFGKRQGKGFGCFFPLGKSSLEFATALGTAQSYKLNRPFGNPDQLNNEFYSNLISKKWGELKSGLNRFWGNNPVYRKSAVFNHLKDKDLRWDKRWIKLELKNLISSGRLQYDLKQQGHDPIDIDCENRWEEIFTEEYRFGRALLGLAEHYEFLTENQNVKYKVIVNGGNIERFQSPLIFKVFDRSVYAFIRKELERGENIHNAAFNFKVQIKRSNRGEWSDSGAPINFREPLHSPSLTEFNYTEFFDSYLPQIGFNKLV